MTQEEKELVNKFYENIVDGIFLSISRREWIPSEKDKQNAIPKNN